MLNYYVMKKLIKSSIIVKNVVLFVILLNFVFSPELVTQEISKINIKYLNLWNKRESLEQTKKLYNIMYKDFKNGNLNKEELILFSRLCFWYVENLMDKKEKNKKLLMEISKSGMESGEKCIESSPNEAGCYYFKAINESRYESVKGISTSSISLLPRLEKLMDKVDELVPGYDCGGTDRFWGRVIYEIPWIVRKIAGYSLEDANEYYEKSIKEFPGLFMTRVYMAELLIKEKKYNEANKQISFVLSNSVNGCGEDNHIQENNRWKRNAKLLQLKYWDLLKP